MKGKVREIILITSISIVIFAAFIGNLAEKVKDGELFSIIILSITAGLIADQAIATNKMVEGSQRPGVDIGLIFDKEEKSGTQIQLINRLKNIPALVWIKIELEKEGKRLGKEVEKSLVVDDRLAGKEPFRIGFRNYITSSAFLNNITNRNDAEDFEIVLTIDVAPTFAEDSRKLSEVKRYYFKKERGEWIDKAWGMPDSLFEAFENIRKKIENK